MTIHVIFNFLIYAIINAITPGPGNILAFNTTVNYGWKKGKFLLFGVFFGYYAVQIICALIMLGFDYFLNPVMSVMKYLGIAYITWLAIHVVLSKPELEETDKKPLFLTGFILQFVNIKIYLFGITALSGYIVPYYHSCIVLLFFAIIIASIGTIATLLWVFLGSVFKKIYTEHYQIINIILGLLLLECVVSLFFT